MSDFITISKVKFLCKISLHLRARPQTFMSHGRGMFGKKKAEWKGLEGHSDTAPYELLLSGT